MRQDLEPVVENAEKLYMIKQIVSSITVGFLIVPLLGCKGDSGGSPSEVPIPSQSNPNGPARPAINPSVWTTGGNLIAGRDQPFAVTVGAKIYIMGGTNVTSSANEEFNTVTATTSALSNLSSAKFGMSGGAIANKIYLFVGATDGMV